MSLFDRLVDKALKIIIQRYWGSCLGVIWLFAPALDNSLMGFGR